MSGNTEIKPASAPVAPKKPRWKAWLQNLALMAGTFLLCVVALEVILRICGYGNLEIYQPDAALYWKLAPNQDCYTKIDHKPVHINSQGTRGPEFQIEKPPDTLRIVSLGDSRTFGWGLTEAETYSRELQRLLQEKLGNRKKVEVINAGVNAWSYPQMQVYFRDTALKYHPDIVILGDANLWTQFSEKNSADFVRAFMRRVQLKNFLRRFAIYHYVVEVQLQDVYQRYRTKFIPVDPTQDQLFKEQQQKDPDAVFRAAVDGVCEAALSHGVKPVLLHLPAEYELKPGAASPMLSVKTEVSQKRRVPLVDLTPALLAAHDKTLYLDADPIHLNAFGNSIIARQLFESVTNLITP